MNDEPRATDAAADAAAEAKRAEEARILARIRDRDPHAVEELHARYAGPLYSLAYQVTGAERFAQDVVQEVFLAVWRDAGRFDPSKGTVPAWLAIWLPNLLFTALGLWLFWLAAKERQLTLLEQGGRLLHELRVRMFPHRSRP